MVSSASRKGGTPATSRPHIQACSPWPVVLAFPAYLADTATVPSAPDSRSAAVAKSVIAASILVIVISCPNVASERRL